MKQIGEAIGVNESRVSQLHARAMQRLRALMTTGPIEVAAPKPKAVRARLTPAAKRPAAFTSRAA